MGPAWPPGSLEEAAEVGLSASQALALENRRHSYLVAQVLLENLELQARAVKAETRAAEAELAVKMIQHELIRLQAAMGHGTRRG